MTSSNNSQLTPEEQEVLAAMQIVQQKHTEILSDIPLHRKGADHVTKASSTFQALHRRVGLTDLASVKFVGVLGRLFP